MSLAHPTQYKFRHWTKDPESGLDRLLWASDGPDRSIEISPTEILLRGSERERELIGDQGWSPNALANEGEVDILDVYFDAQAVRTNLYFGLVTAAPSETTTEATMSELTPATFNYNRIAVVRGTDWGVPTHAAGTLSTTKQFAATGGAWAAATDLTLSTSASGTAGLFIAWSALSQSRTLGDGDTLDVSMTVSME